MSYSHPPMTPADGSLARGLGSFRVPHFAALYLSGWVFNISRWGLAFLGAFIVNVETASPRLVQLTGTFMWAPLLLAGVAGGALSDRIDRRSMVLGLFAVMAPLSAGLGALYLTERLEVWLLLAAMTSIGFGWVIDMTARRALIFDLVGAERINNAMALEMVSTAGGLALGSLLAGSVVELLGVGPAFFAIAALGLIAAGMMSTVPRQRPSAGAEREPFLASLGEALRSLPANPMLVSVLGITVAVNFFHFPFFPIVQVIGERVGASPFGIGALSAASGLGMMISALWVAAADPHRGRVYFWGPVVAMSLMLGFALFRNYWLVLASLFAAALCLGLFGATQGALTMTSVPESMRGRAMGLLSTAIGSLPIGMYALGELAEALGAPSALVVFNLGGLAALSLWTLWRPEARRQR